MARRRTAERSRSSGRALRVVCLAVVALVASAAPGRAATERSSLATGNLAALVDRRDIYLEAVPLHGEGLLAFCRRLTGDTSSCREISQLNRNPRRLVAGVRYRVPYARLTLDLKLATIVALFPRDRSEERGWLHRSRGEGLDRVALWLTGNAANAGELRRANGRSNDLLRPGDEVQVPVALLLPIFRVEPAPAAAPAVAQALQAPAAGPASTSPVDTIALDYGEDAQGKYAIYRLRAGEALYSAVVVRFTGRDLADDVNALSAEIAKRSGIVDVTDIPVGYPVRIPFDVLLPQYLPANDSRRLEWEVERKLAEQFRNPVRVTGLDGVTVVLDAGHGGADVGASRAGVWESIYVYDVMLRVKRALEHRTLAQVPTTTRDGGAYVVPERDVLSYSRGHSVLTTPPYTIGDAIIGVHLRWYLANSIFRRHTKSADGDRIVFVSIHADSLHPSLRGATVYIPNAAGTSGVYSRSGGVFSQRQEYREQPRVSYSLGERQKSEGRSRDLAERIIGGFRSHDLAVHPYQPVRDRIFRGRRAWVPAVLRYNAVPAKILLEICNLANDEDRRLLQTREFRERIAAAVVDGILAYFG
ncbi:MAG TPA: N-acetylmuramoyl-L-alanine amidase [Thermoanaerobaculia bacterium]|nr:N-acetylmuramoyl-L-alanine amidase [Thermoanaerobaculia bacterium]